MATTLSSSFKLYITLGGCTVSARSARDEYKAKGPRLRPLFQAKTSELSRLARGYLGGASCFVLGSLFLALLFRNIAKMAFVIIAAGSRLFGGSVLLCPWFVRSTAVYDRGEVLQRSSLALVHTARVGIIVFSP